MAHPVGERLRCDECGAEIVFVQACTCPDDESRRHENICCSKPMRNLGVRQEAGEEAGRPVSH